MSEIRRVGDMQEEAFEQALSTAGIGLSIGPFDAHIRADATALRQTFYRLYRHYPLLPAEHVYSFHVDLDERRSIFRPHRRRVHFSVDGRSPHADMPAEQGLAVLEWGINLVIAMRAHQYLMLHAAVLERDGKSLVMPAEPGSGKSTLCAALAFNGWRLLSDEFGLVDPESGCFIPIPRAIALKNASVDIIRSAYPDAEFGPLIPGTRKGDVAHLKPPAASIERMQEHVSAAHFVFPRWQPDVACELTPTDAGDAFIQIASNAFNYEMLGEAAFDAVTHLAQSAQHYQLQYSDLDSAIECLDRMTANAPS